MRGRVIGRFAPTVFVGMVLCFLVPTGAHAQESGESREPTSSPLRSKDDDRKDQSISASPSWAEHARTLFDSTNSAEIRAEACRRLAETGGKDAVPFLAYVTRDPETGVREAAARALGEFRTRAASDALVDLLERKSEATEIKLVAAESLARHHTEPAREALELASQSSSQPRVVRQKASALLREYFRSVPRRAVSRGGLTLAAFAGGIYGGWSLMTLGAVRENETSTTIGLLTGAALGGIGTGVYLMNKPVTPAQAGAVISDELWGLWSGLAYGAAADIEDARGLMATGLLGQSIGLVWGLYTARSVPDGGDVSYANVSGLMGTSLAASVLVAGREDDKEPVFAVLASGGLLGRGFGALASPHLSFSPGDIGLTNLFLFESAVFGVFGPEAIQKQPKSRTTGTSVLAGVPAAFVAASTVAQYVEPDPKTVGVAFGLGAYGKMLGAGLPLLGDSHNKQGITASMLGVSSFSLLSSIALAPRMHYSDRDASLIIAGTAWGFWQGIGSSVAANAKDRQIAGASLVGTSTAGLISMGAALKLDVPPMKTVLAVSGGFWGAWIPFWAGIAEDMPARRITTICLVGSDLGLVSASTALAGSERTVRGLQIMNVGGLAGAALGSVIAGIATVRAKPVAAATSIGSAVGLLAGAAVASATASSVSDGPTYRMSSARWEPSPNWNRIAFFPVFDPDWDRSGEPMFGFGVFVR